MLTMPDNDAALRRMIVEAWQVTRAVWLRQFADFPESTDEATMRGIRQSWEMGTRFIALTLGAVYPDTSYDRDGMAEWSRDLDRIRRVFTSAGDDTDITRWNAESVILRRLARLAIADAVSVA